MAKRIPLDELCMPKVATLPNNFDDIIDYIDISSVDNESKAVVAHQKIESSEAPSRARQLLEVGDVLVSTVRPNLNAVALVETTYEHTLVGSTGYCVLRAKEGVDNRFVFYFCQSPYFVEDMTAQATGASYPAVTTSIVRSATVPDYPLEKQKEIARCLESVSSLISLRKQQLAKLDELVKARFVELFGNRGENPYNFPTTTMGNIYKFQYGKGNNIPEDKGEYPCYGSNGVVGHHTEYNSEDSPIIGHIGAYAGIVNWGKGKHYVTYNGVICKLTNDQVNPVYGYYLLQLQDYNTVAKSGAAQPFVSYKDLDAPVVNVPPMEVQNKFAAFVEQTDKSKLTIQLSLDKLELLKKALMQKYFG